MKPETTQERDLRQEWETPQDFFDVVDAEFRFQLDAAATEENAKCMKYITQEEDALSDGKDWVCEDDFGNHRVWLNPGFAKPGKWYAKAYHQAQRHPSGLVVVMGIPAFSATWWRTWTPLATEIRCIGAKSRKPKSRGGGERLQFVAPPGVKPSTNARENCLIIFRPNPHNLSPRIWTWDWTKGLPVEAT